MDPEATTKMQVTQDGTDEKDVGIRFDKSSKYSKKCKIITALSVCLVLVIILIVVLVLVLRTRKEPTPLPTPASTGDGPYTNAVVAADAGLCSELGRDILKKKGSAVDSAIATLFCVGVINMHSAGIGGGGFMTVYHKSSNKVEVFDYREVAPLRANKNMYVNGSLNSKYGASAVAVPGEVNGYRTVWKKYGKLPWKDLVQPAINLAKEGFQFGYAAHNAGERSLARIKNDTGLRELLIDNNGKLKKLGTILKMPKLARTLEIIRDDPDSFYNGSLAEDIVKDIQDGGGIILLEDLKNYKTEVRTPLSGRIGNGFTWYTDPPPSSGAVLSLILNILKGYNFTEENRKDLNSTILTFHRIVEAFKFGFAYRALLGDEDFWDVQEVVKKMTSEEFGESLRHKIYDNRTFANFTYYGDFYSRPNDQGTAHLSIISPDGDAVAATSTINLLFGSKYRSTRTGIIYNDEMDDFSTPGKRNAFGIEPSQSNFIEPGKRPMSSMSPTIFVDSTGVPRLAVGASGGSRIITGISLVIMNYLWFNRNLTQAVVDPRLHHQLIPNEISINKNYPIPFNIQAGLIELGHKIVNTTSFTAVQAVATSTDGKLYGKADPRKGSYAAGF